MRAETSVPPPAGNGTIIVTGRVGYACADAIRDTAVSAAAHAAKCRNCLRWGSFILNPPSPFTSLAQLVCEQQYRVLVSPPIRATCKSTAVRSSTKGVLIVT